MDDKQSQEFNLEDIMKEFASDSEDVQEMQPPEEVPEEPLEETLEETQAEETPDIEATIRFEKLPETVAQVRNAQHIEDEDTPVLPPEEESTEPYSEEWEPDYEQPISDYVPPQPIPFPTRQRLQALKKQLIAGPEKQYYAMSEQGVGKLQLALLVNVIVLLFTAASSVLFHVGIIGENRLRFMVFSQFFCMLLAAALGSNQLVEGVADLLRKRFSLNTMLVFTFVLCCADGVMGLWKMRIPCCAAFSLQMIMSQWNTYHIRNVRMGQLDTMRKAVRLDSLTITEDYYENAKGVLRGEGQVEDFMDTYTQPAKLEKTQSVYAIVALCISVAAGIASGVLHGVSTGIQVAAVTSLAAMPASIHVALSRPMAVLERRHHKVGTVLCGWQAAEKLTGNVLFPIDHGDLFPAGTVKLNGVKFFGSRQPDEIIAYAAALMEAKSPMLSPLFAHLLDSRNGIHYTAEDLAAYAQGGVGGTVNGEAVLAGSLSFLKEMGTELPVGIRVNQAVCVAIDGELCGLFAISFEKDRSVAAALVSLCGYRRLKPVLLGNDVMLTPEFVYDQFGIDSRRMMYAEDMHKLLENGPQSEARPLALVTGTGLLPCAYALTGIRSLRNAARAGVVLHMIGGILGIVMMTVLAVLGATWLLTPGNLFLYELVWMIPGLLITEWTRSV